jgi:hypothetical protein
MRTVPVSVPSDLRHERLPHLVPDLEQLRTLGDVMSWLRTLDPPRSIGEIVTQDEYTHDMIVPFGDRLVLAFDTT